MALQNILVLNLGSLMALQSVVEYSGVLFVSLLLYYSRGLWGTHWVTDGSPRYSKVLLGTPLVTDDFQINLEYSEGYIESLLDLLSILEYSWDTPSGHWWLSEVI